MTGRPRVTLNGLLWFAQCIIAFWSSWVGALRAMVPLDELGKTSAWIVSLAAEAPVRAVGAIEVSLALLVLVPSMSRFWPRLTSFAAIGLAVFSAAGAAAHAMHDEWWGFVGALILTALSFFVAWGRLVAPIPFIRWNEEDPSDWPDIAVRPLNADPNTGRFDLELTRP
jgi:hypothetical protein